MVEKPSSQAKKDKKKAVEEPLFVGDDEDGGRGKDTGKKAARKHKSRA